MDRRPRRFGMGDLMILIAALGVGMANARVLWLALAAEGPSVSVWWYWTTARISAAMMISAWATPLTLACLAFRLRRPRPAWRRVALRPGAAATLSCALIFAVRLLEVAAAFRAPAVQPNWGTAFAKAFILRFNDSSYLVLMNSLDRSGVLSSVEPAMCFGVVVASFSTPCGYAVGAVWLVLALSRRWRPEKSWIDRLGRALGVAWIATTALAAWPIPR